jgi:ribosomal protein S18 acetylase RimI-like enzyme
MKIRTAKLSDSKEILNLLVTTPELQGFGELDSFYSEDFVIDCIEDKKRNLVLLAEENKKIVGLLIAEIWLKKKYSFFVSLVVLQGYRDNGIGTMLYTKYEEYCKQNELKTIIGLVRKSNELMQQFCEKKGFEMGNELYYYEKTLK